MKVAIVHDWLTGMRGGEKVLAALCRIFPGADIFTLFYAPERISREIRAHRITTSHLNLLPGVRRWYRYTLPFMPQAVESFELRGYDLVISSSHAVAKGARVPAGVPHICYCHTPMRYIWDASADYFRFGTLRRSRKLFLAAFRQYLRDWDVRASARVTWFLANSENVRRRIRAAYGRDAAVLYPPVETDFFSPAEHPVAGDYYLVVSALEPYKRIELAIRAVDRVGKRLVIAGSGSQARALRRIAGPRAEFTGWVSDEQLRELYRGCRALLFPGLEDFGMVPVEAQACGKPVIAHGRGGVLESVLPGRTGVFFAEQTEQALAEAIARLDTINFDPVEARRNSLRFSRAAFEQGLWAFLRVTGGSQEATAAVSELNHTGENQADKAWAAAPAVPLARRNGGA